MHNIVRRVAALSLLATIGCGGGEQECPMTESIAKIDGQLVIGTDDNPYLDLVTDDECPLAAPGCVRIGLAWYSGLTFRRPDGPGTYALRDLEAKVCTFTPEQGLRCDDIEGTLEVQEIGGDHIEADITLQSASASGQAHLSVGLQTVSTPCGGGCGNVPLFGLN